MLLCGAWNPLLVLWPPMRSVRAQLGQQVALLATLATRCLHGVLWRQPKCCVQGLIMAVSVADEDELKHQVDAMKNELLLANSHLDAQTVKAAQALKLQSLHTLLFAGYLLIALRCTVHRRQALFLLIMSAGHLNGPKKALEGRMSRLGTVEAVQSAAREC